MKNYFTLILPKSKEIYKKYLATRRLNPDSEVSNLKLCIADTKGKIKDTLATCHRIPKTKKFVVSQLDITDLKKTQSRLKRSQSQLRLLTKKVYKAQEEERSRIARELHDQLTQTLIAIRIKLTFLADKTVETNSANELKELVNITDKLVDSIQDISSNLQGTATLIGDPPSMILAGAKQMSFNDFFWYQGKPGIFWAVQLGAIVSFVVLAYIFRTYRQPIEGIQEKPVLSWTPTITLVVMIICLALSPVFDPQWL